MIITAITRKVADNGEDDIWVEELEVSVENDGGEDFVSIEWSDDTYIEIPLDDLKKVLEENDG